MPTFNSSKQEAKEGILCDLKFSLISTSTVSFSTVGLHGETLSQKSTCGVEIMLLFMSPINYPLQTVSTALLSKTGEGHTKVLSP